MVDVGGFCHKFTAKTPEKLSILAYPKMEDCSIVEVGENIT
jgi:hypothetical protein